ncbi:3411_t:CDS:2 [Ambispora gerdemannii]|uniref:3411_t:CDS:1 n=1 Tax=Ambispora gerdemannii TaxID=144530 RepID=A0A9N8ZVA1_9GLOM|nr:3411_t:CDS:2 [Ambispora gerdemannii]
MTTSTASTSLPSIDVYEEINRLSSVEMKRNSLTRNGGTPGIGKTRLGKEVFNNIQISDRLPFQPHFEYLYVDFWNGIQLDQYDENLDDSVIIGLRIAYKFFILGKYNLGFQAFRQLAEPYVKFLTIEAVFTSIRNRLSLQNTKQTLFTFLHIDEFQLIFKWDEEVKKTTNRELFKNMSRKLTTYMFGPPKDIFVQLFLSGTAPQAILKEKEPTNISFEFIRGIWWKKINGEYEWKLCYPFLQIIRDTGGLSRALQHLLEICFEDVNEHGSDFFGDINSQYYQTIFSKIIAQLDGLYNIKKTIRDH